MAYKWCNERDLGSYESTIPPILAQICKLLSELQIMLTLEYFFQQFAVK